MKITSEKDQQSQYVVRIEIDAAELEEAKTKAARKLSNQLRIPGFRPGKAPRALVERFVGQEGLIEQATRDLLPKAYENALKQEDIRPIADPKIDIESTDPLTIVATIPVEPSVELGDYKDIKFDYPTIEVSDEDVQKVVDQLVEQQSTWEEPDTERPAQEGDQVELDMRTIRDGEEVGEPFQRTGVLGKGELLGQIDDQVQGMSVGEERVIEVKRASSETATEEKTEKTETAEGEEAAETPAQELPEVETIPLDEEEKAASAPMTFKVQLNSIKVQHKPEVNDEFAQSVTDVQTVDELKDRIRKNLEKQREDTSRRELTEKIIKEAVSRSTIIMPPIMVDAEIHALEEGMANRLKQQKLTLDQYLRMTGQSHEDFHEQLRPQAEDRIKTALVLRDIARAEDVTVEQRDLDREVEKMVDQFTLNQPEEQRAESANAMRGYLSQEETRKQLSDEIFSRKLSERLIQLATGVDVAALDEAAAADISKTEGPTALAQSVDEAQVEESLAAEPVQSTATAEETSAPAPSETEAATEETETKPAKKSRSKAKKPASESETDE